jgi:hypothetical protein
MLASHSRLAFPPETGFLRRYLAVGRITRLAKARGHSAVIDLLEADERFRRVGFSPEKITDETIRRRAELTDFAVYCTLLELHAERINRQQVGDKDPRSIEHLTLLHRYFPDARLVHVIRDPRDVVASKKVAKWSRHRPAAVHIFASRVQLGMGRTDGPRLFGSRYHEVFYEALLAEPEKVLERLCVELSIGFEPEMLEFSRTAEQLVSAEEMQWKDKTLGPLLRRNSGKWRTGLSVWETALTEHTCSVAMRIGDYAASGAQSRLSLSSRAALRIWGATFAAFDALYASSRRIRDRFAGGH